MEKSLRNNLRLAITNCRKLLEEDYARQLEGYYGVHADGHIEPFDKLPHLDAAGQSERRAIEAAIHHEETSGVTIAEAVERFTRESAFTTLNRLVALKLMEHPNRKLIQETIQNGDQSKGFQQFAMISPAALQGDGGKGYRLYLQYLIDDLSHGFGVLFDTHMPQSILFPSPTSLVKVLKFLNQQDLVSAWGEDETLGWMYQFFTPPELRDQARKESAAPRNSYELSFRNQFYTPRYVVAFLADNTLGRTWYEMRQGDTQLVDQCEYMIHCKHPMFLAPSLTPSQLYDPDKHKFIDSKSSNEMWIGPNPDLKGIEDIFRYALTVNGYDYAKEHLGIECGDLANQRLEKYQEIGLWEGTFEELRCCLFFEQRRYHHFGQGPEGEEREAIIALYQIICEQWDLEVDYVPYREKRDPRTLRVLDPAGGSGHFLIYCFDLLETIYREAYDDTDLGFSLQKEYPDRESFFDEVPRLIVENNLFGIDIDLRATQIASLAIWLRAQRAFANRKIPIRNRPLITKTNIVCAEPMPGDFKMLGEFLKELKPRILSNLVRAVWDQMELAGEAGSLLKVEQTLRREIQTAHQAWQSMPEPQQLSLFGEPSKPVQMALDLLEIKDEAFWDEVEARVLEELKVYTQHAAGIEGVSRRLFAHDAEQGFKFVDLLQEEFDVVLMNPPFGAASINSKDYIKDNYPRTKNDLYAAFVERGLELLRQGGLLGAITSRTGFFLKSFQKWREEILLKESQFIIMADLGYGVLDTAMVETATFVIKK